MKRSAPSGPNDAAPSALTDEELEQAAREESVATRSVLRALVGLPVRGMAGGRAQRAAAKLRRKAA